MSWSQIEKVFAAKVCGSFALHEALAGVPGLKLFVGYSSVAGALGPKGQANYSGANAYLDALMQARTAAGLPGLAVGWGPWSRIGMAAGLSAGHIRALENTGQRFLRPAEGTRALTALLGRGLPQVLVGDLDWSRFASTRPLDSALFDRVAGAPSTGAEVASLDAILALPLSERRSAVVEAVRALTGNALHYDHADEISVDARFAELGLDSLVAVELKNALENTFRLQLSTGIVFDHPTVAALADHLYEQVRS
jgi:acyl carrier protein